MPGEKIATYSTCPPLVPVACPAGILVIFSVLVGLGMPVAGTALAQTASVKTREPGAAITPMAADPEIVSALKQVSAQRIQASIEKLVSFQTRHTLSAQDPAAMAAGRGVGAAREWIKSEFESYSKNCGGCLEVKTDSFIQTPTDRIPKPTPVTNIYAVLKGTDAENAKRIVLVSGHYDSRVNDILDANSAAPGANDDGSGTAVSLESARILSQLRFPATVIFLAAGAEEQNAEGSKHFAQLAKQQAWNIEAVLNNDIVGGDRNPQQDQTVVRVFSEGIPAAADDAQLRRIRALGGESDSNSRELARYIAEVADVYDPGIKPLLVFRLDRYLRGGDQLSFDQQGYPAIRFTEYREDYNHQHQKVRTENGVEYGDLPKFVNFDYVAQVARLNAATLASLAAAPAPPANVKLEVKELTNNSTLAWDPPAGGRAVAYEVIWRATSSASWERAERVGNVTRATVSVSKDNVIFAVRAIDAQGRESLPVVPAPER